MNKMLRSLEDNISYKYSSIVTLSNGEFINVWQQYENGQYSVWAKIIDDEGKITQCDFYVGGVSSIENTPVVTSLSGGGYVVAWIDWSILGGNALGDINSKIFSSSSDVTGTSISIYNGQSGFYNAGNVEVFESIEMDSLSLAGSVDGDLQFHGP